MIDRERICWDSIAKPQTIKDTSALFRLHLPILWRAIELVEAKVGEGYGLIGYCQLEQKCECCNNTTVPET
jgi:hypothetical protein